MLPNDLFLSFSPTPYSPTIWTAWVCAQNWSGTVSPVYHCPHYWLPASTSVFNTTERWTWCTCLPLLQYTTARDMRAATQEQLNCIQGQARHAEGLGENEKTVDRQREAEGSGPTPQLTQRDVKSKSSRGEFYNCKGWTLQDGHKECLCYDAVNISAYIASNGRMVDK
jgi:hypothetical protein